MKNNKTSLDDLTSFKAFCISVHSVFNVRPHSLVILVSGHTASGTYRCEVSVEKSFYTLSSEKNVTVVGGWK